LIITCSPAIYNTDETVSTLRFGARAKKIKNKAKVNKQLTVAELQFMLDESKKENEILKRQVLSLEKQIKDLGGVVLKPDTATTAAESTADQWDSKQQAEENLLENLDVDALSNNSVQPLKNERRDSVSSIKYI